jgi:DNA-directed RNA polymerase subunit RPC12/RpoP
MRQKSVPLQLNSWIDCPQCGRIDKLSRDFRLPEEIAGPMQIKVLYRCERCGAATAFLYLDRTDSTVH